MNANTLLTDPELLKALKILIIEAGDAILDIYHSNDFQTRLKNNDSPVTKADLAAHHILADGLTRLTPNIPIVSEEDDSSLAIPKVHNLYWLIDPLDGTKEFIQKSNEFTVNVALIENSKTVFGFVGIPALAALYWGGSKFGAYKTQYTAINELPEKIQVMQIKGLTRVFASKSHLNSETKSFIENLSGNVELIKAGSSLKFLRIAEGLADLYPRLAPTCEWDTAAAHAVLEGAGGSVKQTDGTDVTYGKVDILNPHFVAKGLF
jgi:3'(2'), 5'-bisphosphate nucleotidase